MSYPGRLCLEHIDSLQDDADFWERWMDRLHPDEKVAIAYGEIGVIKRPVEPTWPVGEWMEVASNLWLRPKRARYTVKGWRIHFELRDFRVHFPRRVPAMFEPPELDALGYPVEPNAEAIEHARVDGNYTSAHSLAVPDSEETLDDLSQRRITNAARAREREAAGELLREVENLRAAVRERIEASPEFMRLAGRDVWLLRSKLDRLVANTKRRAA